MLTRKEWDAISAELEPQIMTGFGEKEEKYLWAVYGALLTVMKDNDMSIDEVLVLCEEKVTGEKKGLSKKS